jgi:hypothetical protein
LPVEKLVFSTKIARREYREKAWIQEEGAFCNTDATGWPTDAGNQLHCALHTLLQYATKNTIFITLLLHSDFMWGVTSA